jgi:hypothetical protein
MVWGIAPRLRRSSTILPMTTEPFTLTPAERVAIEAILEERPSVLHTLFSKASRLCWIAWLGPTRD